MSLDLEQILRELRKRKLLQLGKLREIGKTQGISYQVFCGILGSWCIKKCFFR